MFDIYFFHQFFKTLFAILIKIKQKLAGLSTILGARFRFCPFRSENYSGLSIVSNATRSAVSNVRAHRKTIAVVSDILWKLTFETLT